MENLNKPESNNQKHIRNIKDSSSGTKKNSIVFVDPNDSLHRKLQYENEKYNSDNNNWQLIASAISNIVANYRDK